MRPRCQLINREMKIPSKANIFRPPGARKHVVWICFLLPFMFGCVAGIPSIPNSPEEILRSGDAYFQKKKYFQSLELYKAFLIRHPGHERSDYAQFMLAGSLFADKDYVLAVVEYRILVTNYGYSEYVDDGYLKEAIALHMQAPKSALDQTKNHESLTKLERFVQIFPQSPLVPEAQKYVAIVKSVLAQKDLATALFYIGHKRSESALIYLDKIIAMYPDNEFYIQALYHRAVIYVELAREEDALRDLEQVLAYPQEMDLKAHATILATQLRGN